MNKIIAIFCRSQIGSETAYFNVYSFELQAIFLAQRLMNFKEINLMMISFDDDRISSLLLLSSREKKKSRKREIKYIMIFITRDMIALINIYEYFEGKWERKRVSDFKFLNVSSTFFSSRRKCEARNNKAIYAVSDNFIIAWSAIQKTSPCFFFL